MSKNAVLQRTGAATYGLQHTLPRLPIPDLKASIEKYLVSLEPILKQKEELGELSGSSASAELAKRRAWADELLAGVGPKLMQRLHDIDATTENNWFDDRFWLLKAYHEWRDPLLINSDWWLMFRPDKNTPAEVAEYAGDAPAYSAEALSVQRWENADWGFRRATWLTYQMALYKLALDLETVAPDASRAGAFCMHQYSRVFGVTRIPARPHDWNTSNNDFSVRHITVMVRDNIYSLDVFDDKGNIYPPDTIEQAFRAIVDDAKKADGAGIGVLTSEQRDTWALAREHLLSLGVQNQTNITSVQKSLFVVSLDSCVLGLPANAPRKTPGVEPSTADAQAMNTSGGGRFAHNRWFDKAITLTIEPNGRTGILGEHSPIDALIPSLLAEKILSVPCPPPGTPYGEKLEGVSLLEGKPAWNKLEFAVDDKLRTAIKTAEQNARKIMSESDIGLLWFDEYGAEWIKKVGRQAPDAYIQMALQVAYALVHGKQVPTYETASTRLYKHGRTDVIRSFSNESYALVKAIRDGKSAKEIYPLLTEATGAHSRQTRDNSFGKGIDRFMAGLRLMFRPEDDGQVPAMFSDPLFAESQSWVLSTSGLSAGNDFVGTGFGCGFADGFGTNYLAGSKVLKFGIEAKRSNPKGNGEPVLLYKNSIVDALRLLRKIVEDGAPQEEPGKAKL
ncbi:hypothetical protein MVES_001602 [Malassezia vespertilionis]|uniref:Choline/carnitine acyltransferase domain-containing protein n=2 Tax=Malassezia vespertilionis TaxID=2020962 RepID=A0A2N1JCW9_9BASI|nr:hypothetical protein MVES_001602 [Malassezia vespertilionis]